MGGLFSKSPISATAPTRGAGAPTAATAAAAAAPSRASDLFKTATFANKTSMSFLEKPFGGSYVDIANNVYTSLVLAFLTVSYIIAIIVLSFDFENTTNINRKTSSALTEGYTPYAAAEPKRRSLTQTLTQLSGSNGATAGQFYLTNFYIQTANIASLVFSKNRAIASNDAIRLALLGGARAFVFDCWPDTTPGGYQHGPTLQTVETGSMWKRTSFNSVPLAGPLSYLMTQAFNSGYNSTSMDPLILYIRFRVPAGKTPRSDTMEMTAQTLKAAIQPYRLDASFNRCRAQSSIPMLPITQFSKKVVVVCNFNGQGTSLIDYINVAPLAGVPVEYPATYAASVTPGATGTASPMASNAINLIRQNLSFVAPVSEDPLAASNSWNVAGAQALGVHCCGMNMDATKMPPAIAKMFATDSFVLKPPSLQYTPTSLPNPQQPPNFKFGTGNVTTPSISLPGV